MPSVRSLVSKRYAHIIAVILLLGKIMPSYSCYKEKKLVYIVIAAPSNYQLFFCVKCTKLNMCLFCNIKLISNAKYIFRFPNAAHRLS